jgi:hypothetical protein
MRRYPILILSVLGLAGCAGGSSAPRFGAAAATADGSGTVLHTEVPRALLAEIVAKAAALPVNRKTRLAALSVLTDAPPPAAADAGGAGGTFDADAVEAAMDVLGAIIQAARAAPAAPPSGAVPLVSYTIRLDRGTTVEIAQPWHPGEQIIGPRERAAIRVVHGARKVVPEDTILPATAAAGR